MAKSIDKKIYVWLNQQGIEVLTTPFFHNLKTLVCQHVRLVQQVLTSNKIL